jgi:hypothetical protein
MTARSLETQAALRKGDVVELIRLMLIEREELRLHPAYWPYAAAAVCRGWARFITSDATGTTLGRPTQEAREQGIRPV